MATEPTQRQREDGRKHARLTKQHHTQHRDRRIARRRNRSCNEDHTSGQETEQDEARLHPLHHQRGDEAAHSEQRLRDSKKVGTVGSGETGLDFGNVVDEEACDCDLGADVAKLRCNAPEERVLMAERLVDVTGRGLCLFRLSGDVGVCDFGDAGRRSVRYRWIETADSRSKEEDNGKSEHEAGDAEIHPLHTLQRVVVDVFKENEGG